MSSRSGNPKILPADYERIRLALLGAAIGDAKTERQRWDVFNDKQDADPDFRAFVVSLYRYLDDSHIDTALRKIARGCAL
jgi:hypothetical protein